MEDKPNNYKLTKTEYQELLRVGGFALKMGQIINMANYRCPKKCSKPENIKNFESFDECLNDCGLSEVSGHYMAQMFMADLLSTTEY